MARKLKIMENDKHTLLGYEILRETMKKGKNKKYTFQDLKYGEKTEKRGKCDTKSV